MYRLHFGQTYERKIRQLMVTCCFFLFKCRVLCLCTDRPRPAKILHVTIHGYLQPLLNTLCLASVCCTQLWWALIFHCLRFYLCRGTVGRVPVYHLHSSRAHMVNIIGCRVEKERLISACQPNSVAQSGPMGQCAVV